MPGRGAAHRSFDDLDLRNVSATQCLLSLVINPASSE
jgi:hypothetical protein